MKKWKKADRKVRLFCLLLSGLPLISDGEEPAIPGRWIEEARETGDRHEEKHLIPQFERELVSEIRRRILARRTQDALESYEARIPETDVPYRMTAIEGGTFWMGSPETEAGRRADEGYRHEVTVSSFWMGTCEVTWSQFLPFAMRDGRESRNRNGTPQDPESAFRWIDWVSGPTEFHVSPDMGMGLDDNYPAVGMTQHSANKFCQWLSLQTGHFYRLPTEAEWEYACRAGTTGPYHCDPSELESFAVIDPQQMRTRYEKVGSKMPNPWSLHDMHGNVMEWCLDGYSSTAYNVLPKKNPWFRATQRYPRVVRGGSWYDEAVHARSAARIFSHPDWNAQDPQLPQSIWWLVDAQWLGFRIVRPKTIPSEEDMFEAWNTGAMHFRHTEDTIPLPQ